MRRLPITRQGWATLLGSGCLIGGGRLLGLVELYVFGGAAGALVFVAAVAVALRRVDVVIEREVDPPRVHAGAVCRIDLAVENRAARRTPPIELEDPVSGTPGARVHIEPLPSGDRVQAAYRLPTDRRGLLSVGPLQVIISDPLGLAAKSVEAAGVTEVTVFPRVDEVPPPPLGLTHDPMARSERTRHVGRGGEDFYALREYHPGDDIRRIHWPTTARTGELMVRQNEMPQHGRATLVLDLRRNVHDQATLELAISAAASIITSAWRRRDRVRLVTSEHLDTGYAAGQSQIDAVLEHLAVASAGNRGSLDPVLSMLKATAGGDALVIITGAPSDHELARMLAMRSGHHSLTVVRFGGSQTTAAPKSSRVRHIMVGTGSSFAHEWTRAMDSSVPISKPAAAFAPPGVT